MPALKCKWCCQEISLVPNTLIWRDNGVTLQNMCTLSPTIRHEPEEETEKKVEVENAT